MKFNFKLHCYTVSALIKDKRLNLPIFSKKRTFYAMIWTRFTFRVTNWPTTSRTSRENIIFRISTTSWDCRCSLILPCFYHMIGTSIHCSVGHLISFVFRQFFRFLDFYRICTKFCRVLRSNFSFLFAFLTLHAILTPWTNKKRTTKRTKNDRSSGSFFSPFMQISSLRD